jgi:hypothetical protein
MSCLFTDKKWSMIEFEATNFDELDEEARLRATEVAVTVVNAVCKAIEEEVDVVSIGIISSLDLDLTISKENFLEALELNIQRVEQAEEFELCAKALKYIKQLKAE